MDYPKRYGSTTARSLLHSILPTGAKARISSCVLSSPASRIKTRSLNASTDRTGRKCSTAGYLHHLAKYEKLRINGFKVTTKNGPMTRWDTCHQLCFVSNCSQGKILLLNCLLDGGAYANISLLPVLFCNHFAISNFVPQFLQIPGCPARCNWQKAG